MSSREQDFKSIAAAIAADLTFSSPNALVAHGDSLPCLRKLPDHCISLILTDPPYHATKKRNIYGDTSFAEDQHYLDWISEYALEWRRGATSEWLFILFCDSSMSARLEVLLSKSFNVLSHIVWTKPNDPGFDGLEG